MAQRTNRHKNIRKITTMGRSLGITLPVEFLDELGWREKQRVVVKRIKGGVVIRDWREKKKR